MNRVLFLEKDNAPDEIKKEYEQYLELQEKTKKEGTRL